MSRRRFSERPRLSVFSLAAVLAILASAACTATGARVQLAPSTKTFALYLTAETSVIEAYRIWSRRAGIDVQVDAAVKDQRVEINLEPLPALDSLRALQSTYNHFHVVLDEHTIVVADDTPHKRREYEEFAIRQFQLEHTDAKDAVTLLRSMLGVRHCIGDEAQQRITLFDTERRLDLAKRLLEMHGDSPPPEISIDVELLEINRQKLTSQSTDGSTGSLPIRLNAAEWQHLQEASEARTVLRSSLATTDRQSGRLATIDRLPISATPLTVSPASVPGNATVIAALYQEIGLELEVTPRVHGANAVTLDIDLLLGNASEPRVVAGRPLPSFTSRKLQSTIRLRNDETHLISGLLRVAGAAESPSELPRLGALFVAETESSSELVLALTPRIMPPETPRDSRPQTLHVGRYNELIDLSAGLNKVETQSRQNQAEADRERVRDELRERLRKLKRPDPGSPEG